MGGNHMLSKFDVGGLLLDRPFRIRRLGHFGFNVSDMAAARRFYCDLLGFSISDPIDFANFFPNLANHPEVDETVGYFCRHGTDHHSFVIFPRPAMDTGTGRPSDSEDTINQITWQVGSLQEVVDATRWLQGHDIEFARVGRDMPGSNWHVYPFDPEGHVNELYYGIEQIGWHGRSKPTQMADRQFFEPPGLPQVSERHEIDDAAAAGVKLETGYRHEWEDSETFDVGGVLLPRPFKIVRIGPVRLFVDDMDEAMAFYRGRLGLLETEHVTYQGHRCVFLRTNTEHHSMALYPMALRETLGLSVHTNCMAFGVQLADYAQLRAAIAYLENNGVTVRRLPPELFPGIDYSAFAIDPDGHAIQLYDYMEQIGWDGRPRPSGARRVVDNDNWPASLDPNSDSYGGEAYLGPWG